MKNIKIKKVKFDTVNMFYEKSSSVYLVMIDHENHRIEFEKVGGAEPLLVSFLNFMLTDKDIRKEMVWASTEYERKYPIFFKERSGSSGCLDLSLVVSEVSHAWAAGLLQKQKEVLHLHVSATEKLNEGIPDMFSGDMYELIRYFVSNGVLNDDLYYDLMRYGANSHEYKRLSYSYPRYIHFDRECVISGCGFGKEA